MHYLNNRKARSGKYIGISPVHVFCFLLSFFSFYLGFFPRAPLSYKPKLKLGSVLLKMLQMYCYIFIFLRLEMLCIPKSFVWWVDLGHIYLHSIEGEDFII